MRLTLSIFLILILSASTSARVNRFFVGKIEVSEQEFHSIDRSLIRATEVRETGDTVISIVTPDIFAKADTSVRGGLRLIKRSADEIKVIEFFLNSRRTQSAILKVGQRIPDLTFSALSGDTEKFSYDSRFKEKVVLINFWATWCGPCLEELRQDKLPSVTESFTRNENFIFLPVCVNHNSEEIENFFNSDKGKEFDWLKSLSVWDRNGTFAKMFSDGGIPLTILIDSDGIIRLNEAGSFISEEQLAGLRDAISEVLKDTN